MIVHKDLEQKSLDWFRVRYGKVGGTASADMTKGSEPLFNELVSTRLEPFSEDFEASYAGKDAERGNDLEPYAKAAAEEYLGVIFEDFGWIESELAPLIGLSPDGLTPDFKKGLEIKCPSAKVHVKYLRKKEVPVEYAHQIVHAFAVNDKLEQHHFISFRPECEVPLLVVPVGLTDMINLGTEKTPKMTIVMVAALAKRDAAIEMEKKINLTVESLKF